MKDNIVKDILAAQISNKNAEKLSSHNMTVFAVLLVFSVSLLSFPFVRQRLLQGLYFSRAENYAGLGGVFQTLSRQEADFHVEGTKLIMDENLPEFLECSGWFVFFDRDNIVDEAAVLELSKPAMVIKQDEMLINVPPANIDIKSSYGNLGLFSRDKIRQACSSTDSLILYIQGFLFAFATQGTGTAIITMILLMAVQYVLFALVAGFLLSLSAIRSVSKQQSGKLKAFAGSLKIVTGCSVLPAFVICFAGLFRADLVISYGWLAFSFATGLRLVTIYLQRVKPKSIIYSA